MEVQKEAFGGLMEYYKKLPIENKRREVIDEIENVIFNYTKVCAKLNVMPNMLLNKEMLNINRKDLTEEEFLHAVYAYLNSLQDISSQFLDAIANLIEGVNKT